MSYMRSYTTVSYSPMKVIKDGRMYEGGNAMAIILQDIAEEKREKEKTAEQQRARDEESGKASQA